MQGLAYTNIILGLLLIVLGYLIKYQKIVEIIAGYDPLKVKNKDALANFVGGHLLFIGLLGIFFGLMCLVLGDLALQLSLAYAFSIMVVIIKLVLTGKNF